MDNLKPILTVDEQIQYLKDKGIRFELMVMTRAYKNKDYYKNNPMLKSTFDFLKMVVDSWYTHE